MRQRQVHLYIPLVSAFFAAIIFPWLRLFFVWAVSLPTTKKNLLQARAESEILEEKNRLEEYRATALAIKEENIISQAERDAKVKSIEDEEARQSLQKEITELRSKNKETATISLRTDSSRDNSRFYIKNISSTVATNVNFKLINASFNPLRDDYKTIFPIKELYPGEEKSVKAIFTLDMPSAFECVLTWQNPDGSQSKRLENIAL